LVTWVNPVNEVDNSSACSPNIVEVLARNTLSWSSVGLQAGHLLGQQPRHRGHPVAESHTD
jgi:hypothetical protein